MFGIAGKISVRLTNIKNVSICFIYSYYISKLVYFFYYIESIFNISNIIV